MTDTPKKPGDAPAPVTSISGPVEGPEVDPQEQQMQEHMYRHLAGMIAPFCPNTDEPALIELAKMGIHEQAQIHETIMPTFMPGHNQVTEYPSVRVVIQGPNGREGGIIAPKRLENVDDAQPGIAQAMTVAFLLTPSVRMCLKAWGFRYRIEQVTEDQSNPTPTLHTV